MSVQVTTNSGQRGGFQLTFTLSKESMLNRVLLPAGYFDPTIRVIVIVTTKGMPDVLSDGIITQQEVTPSSEPGQSTLTVTGEDLSVLMDLGSIERLSVKGIPYPAMPVAARVSAIIAKYSVFGIIPLVIPELFPSVKTPIDQIDFQNGTDLEYLQKLAKENGYVFYIDPGPFPGVNLAYWGPEIRVGVPQPALNINMDAHTNVESLSFGFDGLSRKQPAILIPLPVVKLAIPIPVPEIDLLRPPLAARQAPALRYEALADVAKLGIPEAISRGLAEAVGGSDAISGSGTLDVLRYGRVLKARGLVGVRGAGPAYDGLYYVSSVTHNIKRGEYKQNFQLNRNGLISLTPRVIP